MKESQLKGSRGSLWLEGTCYPKFLLLCMCLCLAFPIAGIFYYPEKLFSYASVTANYCLYAFFILSALFCMFVFFMQKTYTRTRMFFLTDNTNIPPENCYTFSHTIKLLRCRLLVVYYKTLWNFLFFLPCSVCFFVTIYSLNEPTGMLRDIFFTLSALTALLFVTALAFSFCINGRYFLVEYLAYTNPLSSTGEIIASSVLLTQGHLVSLACRRLLLNAYGILSFIPQVNLTTKLKKAEMCRHIYNSK